MKRALQFVIAVSIVVSLAAMSGFAWMLLGYSVAGAFGSVLRTQKIRRPKCSFSSGALMFVLTVWLVLVYRRQFKRQLK